MATASPNRSASQIHISARRPRFRACFHSYPFVECGTVAGFVALVNRATPNRHVLTSLTVPSDTKAGSDGVEDNAARRVTLEIATGLDLLLLERVAEHLRRRPALGQHPVARIVQVVLERHVVRK
jgi:hypothetical protein